MPVDASLRFPEPKKLDLPLIPSDLYQVQLLDVTVKELENRKTREMEPKLSFKFAILDEGAWYGRFLFVTSAMSLNMKAHFFKMFPAIVGRQPTKEEIAAPHKVFTGDFINSMINTQLRVMVSQEPLENDANTLRNKITSFAPVKAQLPAYDEEKAKQALSKQGQSS